LTLLNAYSNEILVKYPSSTHNYYPFKCGGPEENSFWTCENKM